MAGTGLSSEGPDEAGPGGPLPPDLRLLKWLVLVLTATMIAGIIALVALLATRLPGAPGGGGASGPEAFLPEGLRLPEGARPTAVTRGEGWLAVVTDRGEILLYDAATGALRQRLSVTAP